MAPALTASRTSACSPLAVSTRTRTPGSSATTAGHLARRRRRASAGRGRRRPGRAAGMPAQRLGAVARRRRPRPARPRRRSRATASRHIGWSSTTITRSGAAPSGMRPAAPRPGRAACHGGGCHGTRSSTSVPSAGRAARSSTLPADVRDPAADRTPTPSGPRAAASVEPPGGHPDAVVADRDRDASSSSSSRTQAWRPAPACRRDVVQAAPTAPPAPRTARRAAGRAAPGRRPARSTRRRRGQRRQRRGGLRRSAPRGLSRPPADEAAQRSRASCSPASAADLGGLAARARWPRRWT